MHYTWPTHVLCTFASIARSDFTAQLQLTTMTIPKLESRLSALPAYHNVDAWGLRQTGLPGLPHGRIHEPLNILKQFIGRFLLFFFHLSAVFSHRLSADHCIPLNQIQGLGDMTG